MELINHTEQLLSGITGRLQVKALEEAFTTQIEEGYTNPLEFAVRAKMLIDALQKTLDNTKELAMTEQMKHGKRAEVFGAEVTQVESGVRYDYSQCNDSVYTTLKALCEENTALLREREKFLKALTGPLPIVTEDGEIVTINPPIKLSTTTLRVTPTK